MSIRTSGSDSRVAPTAVIGLGNPLMGDDGFGIAALERLRATWVMPTEVDLIDGGTWGLSLLPVIEDAGRVLLIDAIDVGAAAGTEVALERDELPRYLATRLSPHEIDLRDVLALAELRGRLPAQLVAVGVQPGRVELVEGMTAPVLERLDAVVQRVGSILLSWGCQCHPEPSVPTGRDAHRSISYGLRTTWLR